MRKKQRIALIGLDGSGKSANISKMKSATEFEDYKFVWVRWKPILLAPAYWLLKRKVKKSKGSSEAGDNTEHQKNTAEQKELSREYSQKSGMKSKIFKNPIVRGVWMFLALTDYFFQFYFKTFVYLVGRKNIIFDRFYLDLFVDQGINFGYSPEKIDKLINRKKWLFPKIDKIIYICVSPEVCYQRKDDIPNMDYLLRRYDIYETLCKNTGWVTINGELPLEEVYEEIKKEIICNN